MWRIPGTRLDVQAVSHGLFVSFEATPGILGRGLLVSLALGTLSCLLPAWRSVRRGVTEGLRMVD